MTRGNFMSDKKSRTRRQEFLYRNEEMKILHMAKLKKAELTITEFFNQRVDEYLQTEEYPGVDYSGMKIKMNELEKENEQLRATLLIIYCLSNTLQSPILFLIHYNGQYAELSSKAK